VSQFHIGDWVQWVGGSYRNLQGIVIDTREDTIHSSPAHRESHEVKVIWDAKGLGSLRPTAGGSWQRATCLRVLSSVEQNDESR